MQHVINEIRLKERTYYNKTGNRGKIICLDANAEARLAAYLVTHLNECALLSNETTVTEILEDGIRHLGIIICGMKLKFDCPLFCIENKEISITTEILPYNEFPIFPYDDLLKKLADS